MARRRGNWDPSGRPKKGIKEPQASYQKRLDAWEAKREEDVRAAYQEVLGREADESGLVNYLDSGLSGDELRANLASSQEGRRRGADPTRYGAEAINVESLSGGDREAYDKWQQYNPGQTYYSTDRQYMDWVTDSMSLTTWEASQRGLIREDLARNADGSLMLNAEGDPFHFVYVSPEANAFAADRGEKLYFNGVKKGRTYFGDFSNAKTDNIQLQKPNEKGMQTGVGLGSPKLGVFGTISNLFQDLGMNEDWAATFTLAVTGGASIGQFGDEVLKIKESYFLSDPFNISSAALYGREGYEKNIAGGASLFNADEQSFAEAQGIASQVATTILMFVNPFVGMAVSAMRTYGQYQLGAMSAGQAFSSIVISAASSLIGMNVSSLLSQAAVQSLSGAASAKVMGQDASDAALVGAAGALAGGVLGSFTSGVAPQTNLGQFGARVVSDLGTAAIRSEVSGDSLNTEGWIAAAGGSIASGAMSASEFKPPKAGVGPVLRPTNTFSLSRGFEAAWNKVSQLPSMRSWEDRRQNEIKRLEGIVEGFGGVLQAAEETEGTRFGGLSLSGSRPSSELQTARFLYDSALNNLIQVRSATRPPSKMEQAIASFPQDLRRAIPYLSPLGYVGTRAYSWVANSSLGESTINRLESLGGGVSRGFTSASDYAMSMFSRD